MFSGAALPRLRSDTISLMSGQLLGHDRGPAVADRGPTLSAALTQLHLQGAIFLRGEYTEAWAYDSLPPKDAATVLAPGSERLILFHVIASGRAWIQTSDSERHWASAGDVIVLPYGDHHQMGGTEPAECVPVGDLIDPPPWERIPVIRHGGPGAATDVVCGYLVCDHPLFDPRPRALRRSSWCGHRTARPGTGFAPASATRRTRPRWWPRTGSRRRPTSPNCSSSRP